jgi:NADH-quinone oxidoreductase subunit M
MFQALFLGPVTHDENLKLKDVSVREILVLAPILLLAFWIGLYPKPFFTLMAPAVEKLTALVQSAAVIVH